VQKGGRKNNKKGNTLKEFPKAKPKSGNTTKGRFNYQEINR